MGKNAASVAGIGSNGVLAKAQAAALERRRKLIQSLGKCNTGLLDIATRYEESILKTLNTSTDVWTLMCYNQEVMDGYIKFLKQIDSFARTIHMLDSQ